MLFLCVHLCLNISPCQPADLEAKERVMEDMRLALTEQEETQAQMEEMLEEKLGLIQELTDGEKKNRDVVCRLNLDHI